MKANLNGFKPFLYVWIVLMNIQSPMADDKTIMAPPEAYQAVTETAWRYLEALNGRQGRETLEGLLHPVWNGKHGRPGGLRVEDKAAFLARFDAGGVSPRDYKLTSVQVYYGDFAMARADDRANAGVLYLTLFLDKGRWVIAGEVFTEGALGTRNPHFKPANSADEVLAVMDTYYRAVELGKPDWLGPIFHDDWHMKNPEKGEIVSEGKAAFTERLVPGPIKGYYDDRQATDVQILYDHMAIVRIDNPTTRSTTMFTLFKLDGKWLQVDKSWSDPPAQ